MTSRHARMPAPNGSDAMLRHWREAVPNDRLAHLVKDATRALVRALSIRLAAHGVSFGHWTFLRILWEHDGLTQRELSDEAGVMEPTTLAAVRAMARAGYVTRTRSSGDRRSVHVHLTPAGRRLKRALVPLAEEVNAIAVRGTRASDVAATRRLLLAMLENLARDAARLRAPAPPRRRRSRERATSASAAR